MPRVSKSRPLIFNSNFSNFHIFTVKLRHKLQLKLELKLSPPLNCATALPCEK